jgi:hypothetical protein
MGDLYSQSIREIPTSKIKLHVFDRSFALRGVDDEQFPANLFMLSLRRRHVNQLS